MGRVIRERTTYWFDVGAFHICDLPDIFTNHVAAFAYSSFERSVSFALFCDVVAEFFEVLMDIYVSEVFCDTLGVEIVYGRSVREYNGIICGRDCVNPNNTA